MHSRPTHGAMTLGVPELSPTCLSTNLVKFANWSHFAQQNVGSLRVEDAMSSSMMIHAPTLDHGPQNPIQTWS